MSFTISGLAPCGSTPPFSFLTFLLFRMLSLFQLFRLFDFFGMPSNITHLSPFLSPYLLSTIARRQIYPIRCTGATVYKYPCGCRRLTSLSPNLPSREQKLGKSRNSATPQHRNFATPHLLPATTTNATDVMMDCAMVCAMRNAMDSASAMRALLFLLFCGHVVTVSHSDAQMF